MSGEQALERSVLERKERDELQTIAEALGVKPGARTKKADIIDQILTATGVSGPEPSANGSVDQPDQPGQAEQPEAKPRRSRAARAKSGGALEGSPPVPDSAVVDSASSNGVPGRREPAADEDGPSLIVSDAAATFLLEGSNSGDHASTPSVREGEPSTPPTARQRPRTSPGRNGDQRRSQADDPMTRVANEGTGGGQDDDHPSQHSDQSGGRGGQSGGQKADAHPHQGANQGATQGANQGATQGANQGATQSGNQSANQGADAHPNQGAGQGQGFDAGEAGRRSRRRRGRDRERGEREIQVQERGSDQQYQGEPIAVTGFLDLSDQGFGFLRTKGFLPVAGDVYVSVSQVRRFALRKGDYVEGASRPAIGNEKYGALLRIDTVGGLTPDEARQRPRFDDLTPLFPDQKLKMEVPGQQANITARIIDLISPIGKGQRGMIVSPPKAGKTTVIKQIATSIEANNPDVHLMVLLVDERPEEVTDMRRTVKGEVIASTFDRPSEEHTVVAEMAIERAKRLVEMGQDVVIILDGITRLARAYNLAAPASGRLTSGGIDQAAIYPPKRFFGAARNIEEGGSLTILATALVETGSKADDVIFEEFKGTGNMELRLDRRLAERRIYPAIDVNASSTRHEELLFERRQLELVWRLRRVLNGLAEDGSSARSLELLMEKIKSTKSNEEFLTEVAKAQGAI